MAENHDEHHDHVVSFELLTGIFIALMVCTVITVLAAKVDLGRSINVVVALIIATFKASLVAAYFMHLRWDKPFNTVVLLTSLGMLGLFLGIACLDTGEYQFRLDPGYAEERMAQARQDQGITYTHGDEGDQAAGAPTPKPVDPRREKLSKQIKSQFGPLPADVATPERPLTPERVALGRMLYHETRLSKNHDVSCNTCHPLDRWGADGEPTSPGHRQQRGDRNSPTVYNAALQFSQFWDGREPDVEAQAKGPIVNPVEMALPNGDAAVAVIKSIPGYAPLFKAAFPGVEDPITYDTIGTAIGAFERTLTTPDSPFQRFMEGDLEALTDEQVDGLEVFLRSGCVACHIGPLLGGGMYQKLGLVKPYPTQDEGRGGHTGNPAEKFWFKVPTLHNVAKTGPYLHDGSIASLVEVNKMMAEYQLGQQLSDRDAKVLTTFLESLTGSLDPAKTAKPELPPSGPDTPKPDPN